MRDRRTDFAWTAEWIGASSAQREPGFARTLFRREVGGVHGDDPLFLRVASSGRYVLYVNGVEVARGPQRIQPRRLRHDAVTVDAGLLRSDRNVLAAVVSYDDESDALWQRPVASGRLGAEAGLLLQVEGASSVRTDASWRVRRSAAWRLFPKGWLDGVASDSFDARDLDPDWATVGFDDTGWDHAEPLGAGHRGYTGRAIPPVAPFGPIPERELTMPTIEWIDASETSVGVVSMDEGFRRSSCDHPAEVAVAVIEAARNGEGTSGSGADMDIGPAEVVLVRADFGRVVTGMLDIELDAPAGTQVDVRYEERAADGRRDLGTRGGTRRILRDHDRFEAFQQAGMRVASIVVSPPEGWAGRVSVGRIRVRERVQRWVAGGHFRSSDAELEALWRAGVRSVQVNSVDAFTDCPTREQRAWTGDGVVHALVHLTTNSDWSAPRAWVTTAASPRDDGILPQSLAGDLEAADSTTIPSWSLHWVHGWYSLFRYAGVDDTVTDALSVVRGVLRWFDLRRSPRGVVCATGEWDLLDWSSVLVEGESAGLTALWVRALNEYAEVSSAVGDEGSAEWARSRAREAARGFESFWNPDRGLYADAIVDGLRSSRVSQVVNGAAVAAGLVPADRVDTVVERIADPATLVVRTVMSDPAGDVDTDKWARISAGEQIVDWEVDQQIVRAEPFFAAVVHEAYLRAGRVDLLDRALRDWSRFLRDGFDTFGETWRWGTPCHGWSSTPTSDIVRGILGVTPAAPGYGVVRVAPRPPRGVSMEGSVPTPHGLIRVRVADGAVTLEAPVPIDYVDAAGTTTRLAPGVHVLHWEGERVGSSAPAR